MGTVVRVKSKFELFRNISNRNVIIKYPLYKRTEDSKSQYMLYNDQMEPIYDFFQYIYIGLSNASESTKSKQAQDLRLFYVFLQMTGYNINNLTEENIFDLIRFYGGDYKRFNYNPKYRLPSKTALKDMFSQLTVINQLSTCRRYLKFLKIVCLPLQKNNSNVIHSFISDTLNGNINHGQALSSYIKENEYKRLIEIMEGYNDEESILISELIFHFKMELHDIDRVDIHSLQQNNQQYFVIANANATQPYARKRVFELSENIYNKLSVYLNSNISLSTKSFNKKLSDYYEEAGIKRNALAHQNLSSMLRRGCIYRIIFEHNGNISPQELAQILQIRNSSYLKYYIESAKKELFNG